MSDKYWLIEKKIREVIIYNNEMVMKFPKHEKFLLSNKIRELGYDIFELVIVCNKRVFKKTTVTDLNIKHEAQKGVYFAKSFIISKSFKRYCFAEVCVRNNQRTSRYKNDKIY